MTDAGMIRYSYAWGYTSRGAADRAIDAMVCECEVSRAERPAAEPYRNQNGARRYKVTLQGA